MSIKRFYTEKEVREFLIQLGFIYEIPTLKDGYYYSIHLSDDGYTVNYAVMVPFVKLFTSMSFVFYDIHNMEYSYFGNRIKRFKVDQELLKISKERM